MSWSLSTELQISEVGDGRQTPIVRLNDLFSDRENIGNQQCVTERDEQLDAVLTAITSLLIDSGLTINADVISVSASGHANENHNKDSSWANEFVSINIYVKKYQGES